MEKTDWLGTGRRYLDHVVCERAYPIHGNGEFQLRNANNYKKDIELSFNNS